MTNNFKQNIISSFYSEFRQELNKDIRISRNIDGQFFFKFNQNSYLITSLEDIDTFYDNIIADSEDAFHLFLIIERDTVEIKGNFRAYGYSISFISNEFNFQKTEIENFKKINFKEYFPYLKMSLNYMYKVYCQNISDFADKYIEIFNFINNYKNEEVIIEKFNDFKI